MIELLYSDEAARRSEHGGVYAETSEIQQLLKERLDQDGRMMLGRLTGLYLRQGEAERRRAFKEGFSAAVELLLEALGR